MLDRIKNLCDKQNMSYAALERATGLTRGSVSKWDKSLPSVDKAQKVADYFGVSVDYLLGNTDNPAEKANLTNEERRFLNVYIRAQNSNQEAVQDMLNIIDKMLNKEE